MMMFIVQRFERAWRATHRLHEGYQVRGNHVGDPWTRWLQHIENIYNRRNRYTASILPW